MATGNLMKWGEYLQKRREGKKIRRAMERLASQGEREGGQDKFGGKVSGPVGVSSRVQSLWLGKEEEEGGEAGNGLGQQPYGICVD